MSEIALGQAETAGDTAPSYRSVIHHPPVRIVATSRFFSRMAAQVMAYGIMVSLAAAGASQLEISFAKSAQFLAALLFGLQGGMLADSRPKRQILLVGFVLLGGICVLAPFVLGTSSVDLLIVIFLASAINQVVAPGLKSIVAIVSSPAELATTSALVNIIGSIGSSIGSTVIAPILIKQAGTSAILITSGVLYLFSAIRIYRLPSAEALGKEEVTRNVRELDWKPRALSLRYNANWIMANRPVASMLLVGAFAAALLNGVTALVPLFVRDVLKQDPTNSVYIFILSGVGFFVGAAISPQIIRKFGERRVAVWSLLLMAVSIVLLSMIDTVDKPLALISPLRILLLFSDKPMSDAVLAAGLIAFPANLGSTMCIQSVQVYINRNVPESQQGGVFGLQQVQENALNLIVILVLGLLGMLVGPKYVFLFAPVVVGALGLGLIYYTFRHTTGEAPSLSDSIGFLTKDVPPQEIHDVRDKKPETDDAEADPDAR